MNPVTTPIPFRTLLAAATLLAGASLAHGSGTQIGFKDAFATARGNAFAATADNPSALYYNPAGIARLDGAQFSANLYEISVASEYSGTGGNTAMDDGYQSVPSFYSTWHPKGAPWAYGFGVYAPFGLKTEWPANSPLRNFALKNELKYITYNFSGAWQINPTLSLGGSITYNRVSADLSKGLGFIVPGSDMLHFNGDGDCFGFNFGVLWQPSAQHSFGLSYSNRTTVNLKGTTDIVPLFAGEASSARFEFPEVIIAGWSYRPAPEWNLEVNIDWTNWNRFNTVTIEKASGNIPIAFNWDSGFFYEFGATRYLTGGWNVSAGLCYTENSIPDSTYTPIVPDCNRLFYSLGAGYHTDRFSADLAWHYGYSSNRHVTGSPPSLTGQTADGNYDNSINAFSLSLALRF